MTLSAHKIGGPQGVGALLTSNADGAPLTPQLVGGGQQKGLRAGTENLSGIAGFGAAAQVLRDADGEHARIAHCRDHFESALRAAVPEAVIFGAGQPRLISTSCFRHSRCDRRNRADRHGHGRGDDELGLNLFQRQGLGQPCAGGDGRGRAAGGWCALRASFGWSSTMDDVNAAIASLMKLRERVRASSKNTMEAA